MAKDTNYVNRKDLNDTAKLIVDQLTSQLDEKFKRLETDQSKIRSDMNIVVNSVNGISKLMEIGDDERLITIQQLQKIDKWLHMLSSKMGIMLPPR